MSFRLMALAREAGFRGLFAGLGPRMIMTAGLVSGQFLIYDEIKHGEYLFSVFGLRPLVLGPVMNQRINRERKITDFRFF